MRVRNNSTEDTTIISTMANKMIEGSQGTLTTRENKGLVIKMVKGIIIDRDKNSKGIMRSNRPTK
jgi:hypothetical protein